MYITHSIARTNRTLSKRSSSHQGTTLIHPSFPRQGTSKDTFYQKLQVTDASRLPRESEVMLEIQRTVHNNELDQRRE